VTRDELDEYQRRVEKGANPRDIKMELGKKIVTLYHSADDAKNAALEFEKVFSKREVPETVAEIEATIGASIVATMVLAGIAESNADAKRKIEQGGVSIDGTTVKDFKYSISGSDNGKVLKVGKREFRKIKVI